jgi:hypothetical protein
MKFPIDSKVYAIFDDKVHLAFVRAQSRQYREFMRVHLMDNVRTINGHDVPMILDLHPNDVFEDETEAKKVLFRRKLRGENSNTDPNDFGLIGENK